MKVLVDMNLSPAWCEVLAAAAHEAVHWSAVGKASAPDTDVLRWAAANGYAVLTHDLDFGAILAASHGTAPSVVQLRAQDVSPDRLGQIILAALTQCAELLAAGALVSVDAESLRARALPLR
jgi:predicted nuclease of predicted toxin-antitoxin system